MGCWGCFLLEGRGVWRSTNPDTFRDWNLLSRDYASDGCARWGCITLGTARRIFLLVLLGFGAGGSPAATHFSCFAKKSKQKKATRGSLPPQTRGGTLVRQEQNVALRNPCFTSKRQAAAELGLVDRLALKVLEGLALRQSTRPTPSVSAILSDSKRGPINH